MEESESTHIQYKIISLEYSGSTILDIALSNILPNTYSLGEVERTIESESTTNKNYFCSCGNKQCNFWLPYTNSYINYIRYIRRKFSIIDSSKTRSSLIRTSDEKTIIIFLYRNSTDWTSSVIKRLNKLEVNPFGSINPSKYIISFLRIEILRRLILPIPFEWLFRNIHLLWISKKVASERSSKLYLLPFSDFLEEFDNTKLYSHNAHIKRGNRTHIGNTHYIRTPKKQKYQLYFGSIQVFNPGIIIIIPI